MNENKLTLINEKVENQETGEQVDAITVIIEGTVKEVFDTIIRRSKKYNEYTEILKDAIFEGISTIISSIK